MRLARMGFGVALLTGLASVAAADEKKEIVWAKTLDAALKEAKASSKIVMVDVYTDWCGPCKKLDAETYRDPKVVELASKELVAVKVNAEKDGGDKVAAKYNVDGYPTIIFLNGEAEVVARIVGYRDADSFVSKTRFIVAASRELPGLLEAIRKEPANPGALLRAATLLATKGDGTAATELLVKSEKGGLKANDLAKAYNAVGDVYQEDGQFDKAVMLFRKAAASTDPHDKAYALSSVAACYISQGDIKKAEGDVKSALVDMKKGLIEAKAAVAVPNIPADMKSEADRLLKQINEAVASMEAAEAGAKKAAELLKWKKNLDEALSDAKKAGKYVMLDVYADWCGPCKELERTTYADEATAKTIAQSCVSVKLNSDEKEGGEAARKYKVTGLPTILFLDSTGAVVGRIVGYAPPEPFTKKVESILKAAKEFPAKLETARAKPADLEAVGIVVNAYAARGEGDKAKELLEKARTAGADAMQVDKLSLEVAEAFAEEGELKTAGDLLATASGSKDPAVAAKAKFLSARVLLNSNKFAEGKKSLENLVSAEGTPADVKEKAKQLLERVKAFENAQKGGKGKSEDD